jgi:uncharacterized protein (DUF362 family)
MIQPLLCFVKSLGLRVNHLWLKMAVMFSGAAALIWFLIRVIPKPSRASYPCQRAAFPVATSFVIWLCASLGGKMALDRLKQRFARHRWAVVCLGVVSILALTAWSIALIGERGEAASEKKVTDFNFIPATPNDPKGIARGINPGLVVWGRDPKATKWDGQWKAKTGQWWTDDNTDQTRVDGMLAGTLLKLTSGKSDEDAWKAIFRYYNKQSRNLEDRGYQPGETVAVKINLNNATASTKDDNYIDASPQMVLAMVRQLVNQAHVPQANIIVYDAQRFIYPFMLTKVWSEFKDVRFVQKTAPTEDQPKNPAYGDFHGLEGAEWVEGVDYSNGKYKKARQIPKQILESTYLVNLALLKAHSYPYNTMEDGDNGQTAVTMTGKNHFGSILGTSELHKAINTDQEGVKNAYSPMVDLAASPNLGAKTILYVLDGLYCGRKWRSYPLHFPNPPFNNRVAPYENSDWPASVLVSMDGVALDSVGLDILNAQTKNNDDEQGHPRVLIRANADDYLFEMAEPDHAPSGTAYKQGGKPVTSLGVHEHWDSDASKRYSRNLDPVNGKGIDLMYLPMGEANDSSRATPSKAAAKASVEPMGPAVLPGKGLAQHDFFYAGEAKTQDMFIVRQGKIVWSYRNSNSKGEISDAMLLSNGNVLFAHQFGVTEIAPDKSVVWNYDAPKGSEIHTAQAIGKGHVLFVQNGDPAMVKVVNTVTGATEKEFELPVGNPKSVHGQFRHVRLSPDGTLIVTHMDMGKVCEYDANGKEIRRITVAGPWGAQPLANGNLLITGKDGVREVNKKDETVWEFAPTEVPDIKLLNLQLAYRLANGNTVINNWSNQWSMKVDITNAPVQAIELTADKKPVWGLRSWEAPADLGPATTIQFLDEPSAPENVSFGGIK